MVAPSGCAWTAAPSAAWISVTGGKGPGIAPLAISVAANTGAVRAGTIAIGSASIAITQAAAGCTYSLSSGSLTFAHAGGQLSVNVTAGAGCDWTVAGLPRWLTATAGASGTGNGMVTLQAAPNPFPGTRPPTPFTITIASKPVSVNQN